jgi:hypothetical protein
MKMRLLSTLPIRERLKFYGKVKAFLVPPSGCLADGRPAKAGIELQAVKISLSVMGAFSGP